MKSRKSNVSHSDGKGKDMGIFGSSYPPGCSGPPESDYTCEVCGRDQELDQCICPECPECGAKGDPECYAKHGMIRTPEQIESRAKVEAQWEADALVEFKAEQAAMAADEAGWQPGI